MELEIRTTNMNTIKRELNNFTERLERRIHQKMSYLAFVDSRENPGTIYFLFNTDIGVLHEENIPWDGEVFMNLTTVTELLNKIMYILKDISDNTYLSAPEITLKSRLKKPIIKFDGEAEEYLKQFNVSDQGFKSVDHIHDKIGGNTRIYEYFLESPT